MLHYSASHNCLLFAKIQMSFQRSVLNLSIHFCCLRFKWQLMSYQPCKAIKSALQDGINYKPFSTSKLLFVSSPSCIPHFEFREQFTCFDSAVSKLGFSLCFNLQLRNAASASTDFLLWSEKHRWKWYLKFLLITFLLLWTFSLDILPYLVLFSLFRALVFSISTFLMYNIH